MPTHATTLVFKVLRKGLPRYILCTCHMPTPVITFMSKVLRNGLRRYIHYTHDPMCENVHIWKVFWKRLAGYKSYTCVFNVLRNGMPWNKFYTCPHLRKHSCSKSDAKQWTAFVQTLHMPTPLPTFVFEKFDKIEKCSGITCI